MGTSQFTSLHFLKHYSSHAMGKRIWIFHTSWAVIGASSHADSKLQILRVRESSETLLGLFTRRQDAGRRSELVAQQARGELLLNIKRRHCEVLKVTFFLTLCQIAVKCEFPFLPNLSAWQMHSVHAWCITKAICFTVVSFIPKSNTQRSNCPTNDSSGK